MRPQRLWPDQHRVQRTQRTHDHRDEGAKKPAQAQTGDGPQQPADVVARRTAQRVQCIAYRPLQPTPVHPVIRLGVANQRLDGLASLEQSLFMIAERLVLASVDDLHARVVGVHAPVAQVDDDLLGPAAGVLQQVGRLLELGAEHVAVVRVAGEASGANPTTPACG